jgi:hypothetical protein
MMIALQQGREWLRPLLLILPAVHLRLIDKKGSGDSKRKRNDELVRPTRNMEATEAGTEGSSDPGSLKV